jgi:hypothetical protein
LQPAGTGNVLYTTQVKIAGVYYPLEAQRTVAQNGGISLNAIGYVLEAGQTLAVNIDTASVLNINFSVIEFNDTTNSRPHAFSPKVLAVANGNTTIYTVPAGKSALVENQFFTSPNGAGQCINQTGLGLTSNHWNLVKSGDSPGTGNQAGPNNSCANNAGPGFGLVGTLAAGDSISFASAVANSMNGLIVFTNVIEY